jgi:hypothetical protein
MGHRNASLSWAVLSQNEKCQKLRLRDRLRKQFTEMVVFSNEFGHLICLRRAVHPADAKNAARPGASSAIPLIDFGRSASVCGAPIPAHQRLLYDDRRQVVPL